MHGWRIASLIMALPVDRRGRLAGCSIWMRRRGDPELLRRTIGAALPGIAATLLLFWQTRTGPASQMMAVVGCAALGWVAGPAGVELALLLASGGGRGRRRSWWQRAPRCRSS